MASTLERREQVAELFEGKLEFNKIYSRSDLELLMDQVIDYHYNITAFTYNRWNKGMTALTPILEHIDRGQYRFLGSDYPYNGPVSHFPQGEDEEYIIGHWRDGKFTFSNREITSFNEWLKSDYDGERVVSLHTKFTVLMDGERKLKMLLTEEGGGITNGYGHIGRNSKLGSLLKGKTEGDEFQWGDTTYKVLSID